MRDPEIAVLSAFLALQFVASNDLKKKTIWRRLRAVWSEMFDGLRRVKYKNRGSGSEAGRWILSREQAPHTHIQPAIPPSRVLQVCDIQRKQILRHGVARSGPWIMANHGLVMGTHHSARNLCPQGFPTMQPRDVDRVPLELDNVFLEINHPVNMST